MSKYITLTVVCSHVRERIVGVGRNTKERGKGDLSGIRLESEKGISLTHMGGFAETGTVCKNGLLSMEDRASLSVDFAYCSLAELL